MNEALVNCGYLALFFMENIECASQLTDIQSRLFKEQLFGHRLAGLLFLYFNLIFNDFFDVVHSNVAGCI